MEMMAMIKGIKVPSRHLGGLARYFCDGIPPGSFLMAVLENNLAEAMGRADPGSLAALHSIVMAIYNHAPLGAWGSPERVQKWLENPDLSDHHRKIWEGFRDA